MTELEILKEELKNDKDLLNKLKVIIKDTEDLLEVTEKQKGEKFNELKEKLKDSLYKAQRRVRALEEITKEKTEQVNNYVHDNPWKSIGVAAGAGVIIGFLLGRK